MTIARKIGSGLLFALAVLTFLACLFGVFGAWVGKATVDQTSLATIDLIEGYLGLASQLVESVDGGLAEAARTIGTVREGVASLQTEGAGSPVAQILARTVSEDLVPRLDRLAAGAAKLHSGLGGLNDTLAQLNRVPFLTLPSVADDLAALDTRIAEVGAQARELQAAVASLDGSRVLAISDSIDARISGVRDRLATLQQRITGTQTALADISASLTVWSTIGASVLTFLLIIFAVGQASLAAHAWTWMRLQA